MFQPAQQHTLSQCSFCYTVFPSPSEWISDYEDSVLDPEALRVEVDTFMEAYDKKIAEVGLRQDPRYQRWSHGKEVPQVLCVVTWCLSLVTRGCAGSRFACGNLGHLTG